MAFENYKPSLDDPNAWVPYRYYPSVPAAAIFIALYSIVTIAHIAIIVTSRTWSFTPFIIGGLCGFFTSFLFVDTAATRQANIK